MQIRYSDNELVRWKWKLEERGIVVLCILLDSSFNFYHAIKDKWQDISISI